MKSKRRKGKTKETKEENEKENNVIVSSICGKFNGIQW